jgi:hypothetical protein
MMLVRTLGSSRIEAGVVRYTPAAAKKFGFLLFLSAQSERRAPRALLQAMFFHRHGDVNGRHLLRELLYKLRQDGIALDSDTHSITLSQPTTIDWQRVATQTQLGESDLRALEGGFLPRYSPSISEDFNEWLDAFRASVVSRLVQTLLLDIERAKHVGDWVRAERGARACLAFDTLNGRAVTALAEMLTRKGSGRQALKLLATYEKELDPDAQKLSVSIKQLRRVIAEEVEHKYAPRRAFAFGGREDEMSTLSSAFLAVRNGAVRVVLLSGEPGIGKSRIISEFAKRASIEGATTVRVNAHPHDVSLPLGTISDIVRSLIEQPGALGCSPNSMEWLSRLIDPRRHSTSHASSGETSYAIGRAVVDLANAVSAEAPLVLIVDDAHWVDDISLRLLNTIASPQSAHILLIFSSRDAHRILTTEYWGELLCVREVGPLKKSAISILLATELELIGCDDSSLLEWMVETSGGNPFFADCLLNHFRSTREPYSIPSELNSILDQRIASLSDDARDVLEAVVVLGRHATISRLDCMVDRSNVHLIRATRELEGSGLIVVDKTVKPSHSLIAESVQRNSSAISHRILCRRMAAMLEGELSASRDSSELWECAEAWVVAGESRRAADLIATCADRCLTIGRAREAALLSIRAAGFTDGDRRKELAESGIRIANSAGESSLVIRGFELLGRSVGQAHDEIELAVLTAQSRLDIDVEHTLASLVRCMSASSAPIAHRLSAATGFLIFCDQNQQVDKALQHRDEILELLENTSRAHEIETLLCSLIYNASFGDLASVPPACERLLNLAVTARVDIAADLMRKAAAGFTRCGMSARSIEILERCHELATDIGLSRLADAAAVMLASQCRDTGLELKASAWFAVILNREFGLHDDYLEFTRLVVLSEFAFHQSDAAALRAYFGHARRILGDRQTLGARRLCNALQCALAHLDDNIGAAIMVDELTRGHVPGHEIGDLSDFEVAVATSVLRDRQDVNSAALVMSDYLERIRRPGAPLSFVLTTTAQTVGLDAWLLFGTRQHPLSD